jgi:UDP-GlcNAc:undecaprenyl-phosphate GlcNAc-1-phosphate transferase
MILASDAIWPAWLAFFPLALLAAVLVRAMIAMRIMDQPTPRKAHARPTPTCGGIGVLAACLVAPLLLPALRHGIAPSLLAATSLLGLVSLADDFHAVGAAAKFLAQLAASLLVVALGLRLGPASWGLAGLALTVFFLVFVTNAFNFMDGLDGLAGGTGLVAATLLAAFSPAGSPAQAGAWALAAGLAGFLPFNLPRARIFLGDVGSQPVGFLLGALGVAAGQGGEPGKMAWLMPMLLSGLLLDVGLTLARRATAGVRLTEPHREHLYQLAHRTGFSPITVAATHWGFSGWGGLCWLLLDTQAAQAVPLLLAGPLLAWTALVRARTVRAGIASWRVPW